MQKAFLASNVKTIASSNSIFNSPFFNSSVGAYELQKVVSILFWQKIKKMSSLQDNLKYHNSNHRYQLIMKSIALFLVLTLLMMSCQQTETEVKTGNVNTSEVADDKSDDDATEKKLTLDETTGGTFNKELAEALNADEYGMKQYVMAFLKKGPNRDLDSAAAAKLQQAHLDNINKLAAAGKLVLAGPFMDDSDIRGIYIFDVTSIEEAQKLTATDPAIKAGSLIMELRPWYGSAALMKVNEIHETIAAKAF